MPAHSIRSKPVRTILSEQLITPALQHDWGVTAVRLTWPKDDGSSLQLWDNIVRVRAGLDDLVKGAFDCLFFVSAITATVSSKKNVCPAVGYWIVSPSREVDAAYVMNQLTNNPYGAQPRLILQPYQRSEKDFSNVLSTLLKDNIGGCVPRYVQVSQQRCYGRDCDLQESAVQVVLNDPAVRPMLEKLIRDLAVVRFPSRLLP